MKDSQGRATSLAQGIALRIQHGGPISYAEFMRSALYDPEHGYYSRGPSIGPRGDFTTSPEASSAFGILLARHIADVDKLLGSPDTLDIIECGPGLGTLARDLLGELHKSHPEIYSRLRYNLVEISHGLSETQRRLLLPAHGARVRWFSNLDEIFGPLDGALIANEVVDAFPVHVVENREGTLLEHFVDVDAAGKLHTVLLPLSTEKLELFLKKNGIALNPGERIEINLAASDWVASAARALRKGVATIIDYGDTAPARYSPARREGTLLAYHSGAVTDDLLAHPGEQDLTALVDFTALIEEAAASGFEPVGLTRQANFLLGLGLGTDVRPDTLGRSVDDVMQARQGVQALISPEGLGRFHVLVLSRGLPPGVAARNLSGLRYASIA